MDLDLVGTTEIGQMLGVSRQRAAQLAAADGFPSRPPPSPPAASGTAPRSRSGPGPPGV